MADFPDIPGADYVDAWYGSWPDFAAAEIMALYLNRLGKSWLQLYLERPTTAATSGEAPGGIITFSLIEIEGLSLNGMDRENRLSGLTVSHDTAAGRWRLTLTAENGLSGWLNAHEMTVDLSPDETDPATTTG